MIVKIMLENTEDLRWVAILLDKSPPQLATSLAVTDPSESATGGSLDGPEVAERVDGAGTVAGDEEVA